MITYVVVFCLFVFFSLIVYYLSIIADAVSGRAAEREEQERQNKQ